MLRRHPKYITFLAPLVTWFMTVLAGTGHTAFSTPVSYTHLDVYKRQEL